MVSPRLVACPCFPQLSMILSLSLSKTLFLFPTHKQPYLINFSRLQKSSMIFSMSLSLPTTISDTFTFTASTFYLQQSTTVLFRKHIILAHQPYTIRIIILLLLSIIRRYHQINSVSRYCFQIQLRFLLPSRFN